MPQLQIYRSSRVEHLAALLGAQLLRDRPAAVLAPQTVLVGHLGMKRWLQGFLARQSLGPLPRIAANLDLILPGEWLDRLALRHLRGNTSTHYRRELLRWRIYQLLPGLSAPQLRGYLDGAQAARRRFQLADRLAGLYGLYLTYRQDWMERWLAAGGRHADHWQAELWRRLVAVIGVPHRSLCMGALVQAVRQQAPDSDVPAIHVFGVSHLPPDVLRTLEALAASTRVCLYFPDPCRELWEDVRRRVPDANHAEEEGAFLDLGHRLLADLGRLGQHFTLRLNQLSNAIDDRDHADIEPAGPLPAGSPLLHRVQHGIRCLRPDWTVPQMPGSKDPRSDASLRIHACHTRLRELEVLKDALLDCLRRHPDLYPHEIVVMAPNMAQYAPLLPVVFGRAGSDNEAGAGHLPYHLGDISLQRGHPLLGAFHQLLRLPEQRMTRSQVLALLALPAVRRRLQLSDSQYRALERWLQRCHVAWGLDGAMKADFGAAPLADHSFEFALDRMCAGYLIGQEDPDWLLDEEILPADPVHGPDAQCLGALADLLELLRHWRQRSATGHDGRYWTAQILAWVDDVFRADPHDQAEAAALTTIRNLVQRLGDECAAAQVDALLDWSVVREMLEQGLQGIPEQQTFLPGAISFCGMVPQRSIPYRVIAVLGLNDGEYPRPRKDSSLDLMQSERRIGDRDGRIDDRYLFLEAIMSARDALHLSYIGEGAHDGKARNPAAPLAELLAFLEQVHTNTADEAALDHQRPWLLRHPLQPFDERYFLGAASPDPRLFSYSREYANVRADACADARAHPSAQPWRFLGDDFTAAGKPDHAAAQDQSVELGALCRFYAKPADALCRNQLLLSRRALDDAIDEDLEPLVQRIDGHNLLLTDLVWQALRRAPTTPLPLHAPARLARSGLLASGMLGQQAYEALREQAQGLLDLARQLPPFANASSRLGHQSIDLHLGPHRLTGQVGPIFSHGDAHWLLAISPANSIHFGQLVPLYLQWACLCLIAPDQPWQVALLHPGVKEPLPGTDFTRDRSRLQAGLLRLLDDYNAARATATSYFPRTSYAYARALHKHDDAGKALAAATQAWESTGAATGERDYAPGYNALLGDDESFLVAGTPSHRRFANRALDYLDLLIGRPDSEAAP